MEYTAEEQREYEAGLAEGYSPASMKAGIEKRRLRKESVRQEPMKRETVKEIRAPAPSGGGSSKWSKIGAGIGKVGAGLHKFLFTPGGRGYDEDPVRFKNSGRYKHQPKVVYVREQPKKKTQKIVREAPTNPFASDFSGGGGFSPRREEVEYRTDRKGNLLNNIGRVPKEIRERNERNVSPFESDIDHVPGMRKRKR